MNLKRLIMAAFATILFASPTAQARNMEIVVWAPVVGSTRITPADPPNASESTAMMPADTAAMPASHA